ncbi:GT2 family glycosyltransferase [Sphingomonas vulcanisoli]|uniref:GT2 family glycosyltransferase n=1 Tax=Sphingomonas vulcanisoli TaxID=1658060 RepID=A0ABX0TV93_9SPHN|nr:glycosyltransferase family 2 protein [Sphingomonas vulcanisoli]NIJ09457.1 GT2 family glycosyltransferase [Sphingomonas vulcanisoli]
MGLLNRFSNSEKSKQEGGNRSDMSPNVARRSVHRTVGDRARDAQDWQRAVDGYQAHLLAFPEDFAIWVQLAHAHKQNHHLADAEAAYLKALAIIPDDADLLLNLGHFYKKLGLLTSSADFYLRSLQIEASDAARTELSSPEFRVLRRRDFADVSTLRLGATHILSPALRSAPVGSVDQVTGWSVSGWAVDRDDPTRPVELGFFRDGDMIARTIAESFRGDVAALALAPPFSGFEVELPIDFSSVDEVKINVRSLHTGQELAGSPITIAPPHEMKRWLQRKARMHAAELAVVKAFAIRACGDLKLSIVMPVYNTPLDWLREALDSVLDQWCDAWELICVDDASSEAEVREMLTEYSRRDPRILSVFLDENVGIAKATNAGIAVATGDYIAFMDHDDYLEPDAVYRMLGAANTDGAELIYSDEAITGENINVIRHVAARCAFSHDYYLSHPYFVHFVCLKSAVARSLNGLDETMQISADVDFILRAIEKSEKVTHVPSVLYRWRTHDSSTGHQKKSLVTAAMLKALTGHLGRMGYSGAAAEGPNYNTYKINFADTDQSTLIVIPTKDGYNLLKTCIESIWATTAGQKVDILIIDHDSKDPKTKSYLNSLRDKLKIIPFSGPFNYAKMNNYAVRQAGAGYDNIVFMNNDIEAIEPGWLERLRSLCARGDVGVAGATLLYSDDTIQHAGVVLGLGDLVDHAHKFLPFRVNGQRNLGYNVMLVCTRDYTAVTGACMMVPRKIFEAVGGFDETLEIGYNDTDLSMRIGSLGYKILNDPYAVLYHHESATRARTKQIHHPEDGRRFAARWSDMLIAGDPFYNPLLIHLPVADHRIGSLDDWYAKVRTREVRPVIADVATAQWVRRN